jgi:hypothetical protein
MKRRSLQVPLCIVMISLNPWNRAAGQEPVTPDASAEARALLERFYSYLARPDIVKEAIRSSEAWSTSEDGTRLNILQRSTGFRNEEQVVALVHEKQ